MQAIKNICQRFLSLFARRPVVKRPIVDESKVYEDSDTCSLCSECSSCCHCDPPPPRTDILPFRQVEMPTVPRFPAPQPLDDTAKETDTRRLDEDESEDKRDECLGVHEE
jgi:hypothetical protein